jgi:hypothetical protein
MASWCWVAGKVLITIPAITSTARQRAGFFDRPAAHNAPGNRRQGADAAARNDGAW